MLNFQIARFIGGENAGEELQPDNKGWFVSSIDVGRIKADSGDKYECSPSPGSSAIANVQVITEGKNSYTVVTISLLHSRCFALIGWILIIVLLRQDSYAIKNQQN